MPYRAIGFFLLISFTSVLPLTFTAADKYNISYLYPAIFGICMVIHSIYVLTPVFPALLIFGEIGAHVCSWISALTEHIRNKRNRDGETISTLFMDCKKLAAVLDKTSDLFTHQTFALVTIVVLGLVSDAYRVIAFFIDFHRFDLWISLMIFGFILYIVFLTMKLFYLTHIVQKIDDQNKDLIAAISDVNDNADPDMTIVFEGEKCSFGLARDQVLHHLKSFEGFSALGFFYLRKSLISSIFANFVTYLIILVQFKVTEVTSK